MIVNKIFSKTVFFRGPGLKRKLARIAQVVNLNQMPCTNPIYNLKDLLNRNFPILFY